MENILKKEIDAQFCVVGGGMAGVCAAIAAARHGVKTVLMQDRPVLGGNASSEIRMWICGAHGENNRETGIIEEIELENFYRNTGLKYTVWDSVVYEKVMAEPNITLLLNCSCLDADTQDNAIKSITGWQTTTQTYFTIKADYYADCSGDSILAPLSNAEFTFGREAKAKYNEPDAPEKADRKTMGMSCLFEIRETDSEKKYIKPEWAYTFKTDDELPMFSHNMSSNFWYIELGGEQDGIADTEQLRHELLKIAFGVWDHFKNQGDHGMANWELDWIGFLPGKRESRRYIGDYVVVEQDVQSGGRFDDIVAYGGWTIDNHDPAGFFHKGGRQDVHSHAESPWGIPYRALYSKNIKNLWFAGRNISVSHLAMSSSRVMATCALLGQAVGTAAAVALRDGVLPRQADVKEIQRILMNDDCFLPYCKRQISALTMKAKASHEKLRNGIERTAEGLCVLKRGEKAVYEFENAEHIKSVRLVFDSDLNRDYPNMPCRAELHETRFHLPKTLTKDFDIIADGKTICEYRNNRQRLVNIPLDVTARKIELIPLETTGADDFGIFSFEVM